MHRPLVALLVVVAALAERPVVALLALRAPRQLAVAAADQVDGPDQHRAAGRRHLGEGALVDVPVGVGVELEPVRLAAGRGDLLVGLRALVRLDLQDAAGLGGAGRAALAFGVIRLEGGHRAQEERRVPALAEQRHRGVELGRVGPEPPRPERQLLEALAVGIARLEVVDAHVDVGPVLRQGVGVGDPLEVPDVDGLVGACRRAVRSRCTSRASGGCAGCGGGALVCVERISGGAVAWNTWPQSAQVRVVVRDRAAAARRSSVSTPSCHSGGNSG